MAKKTGHLDEERIIAAIVDEQGLDFASRHHLIECTDCRALRGALESKLARFGELSRENSPLSLKRPRLAGAGPKFFGRAWRIRPSLGMGLAVASLLVFFLSPHYLDFLKPGKNAAMEKVYLEMLQDERFMAEIEKLEDNPLPRFYVDISDFSDQDGPDDPRKQDSRLPGVQDEKAAT